MNVGGSNSNRFNDIKYARPKNGGEPGISVEDQKLSSARPPLELISRDNRISRDTHSEFSPIKVLARLEADGTIDKALLEPYSGASSSRTEAMRLKEGFFDPVVDYARNSGRDVEAVKQQLKDAILSHIDLTQVRLRPELSASPIRPADFALAA